MVLTCNTIIFFLGDRGKFLPVKTPPDQGPVSAKASPLECLILMKRESIFVG